jgi:predicted nucleic acid-binding protein
VARAREERPDAVIDGSVVLQGVLSSAAIVPLNEGVVIAARKVKPVYVGALDAIHIATALSLGKQLAGVATYDKRMQDALMPLGVRLIAPEEPTRDASTADASPSTARAGEATE